ncbi:MAG: hypothetical protein ACLSFL_00445 [Faecalibacterium sp.]
MKTLFRILGTAAAVAVTGAAIVALDKILNQKDPLHVEEVEFPEDAERTLRKPPRRRSLRRSGNQSLRCCQRKGCRRSCPEAEEAAAPAAPAEGGEKPVCDPEAPNPNPVEAGPAVAPKDASGKFDPTKIAEASDFGDWEEQGCKG